MEFLVATDGSDEADAALAYAADIADAVGGSITVAYAVDPAVYDVGGKEPIATLSDAEQRLVIESVADAEERGMRILDDAVGLAAELGHEVETELLYGDPVREITDLADAAGFDAIYVGHRGRSERAGLMLGSVAKEIVERARMPVTVVR